MKLSRGKLSSLVVVAVAATCLLAVAAAATAGDSHGRKAHETGKALAKGKADGHGKAADRRQAAGHLKHVFVIVLENHSASSVVGDPNMPYVTSLADRYGLASQYYGVTHPSEPNYVALVAGSTFGHNSDDAGLRYDGANLADQLEASGHTWAAYEESMPEPGWLGDNWPADVNGTHDALYASKHNPFILFTDIRNDPARRAHIKPYSALAADLNGKEKSIPDFSLIVPNQCHDLHGGVYGTYQPGDGSPCGYSSGPNDAADVYLKQQADSWVHQAVTTIMSSKAWSGNSAIFVIADESDYTGASTASGFGDTSGCCDSPYVPADSPEITWPGGILGGGHAPAIVISRNGPRGYVSQTPYNHYSLLTTIEQNWHLGYLGNAGDTAHGVVPMNDLLKH